MPLFASYKDFRRLETKVDAVFNLLGVVNSHLSKMENRIMTTLSDIKAQSDALIAKVTNLTQIDEALATYIQGLKDQLAALAQQLADAIANDADPQELAAISDNITAAASAIDAAAAKDAVLTGTTPPTPVPVPVPAPVGSAPSIASISPSTGLAAGGTSVTINGSGFTGVTAVTFGGVSAPSVVPDHDARLVVTTPPGSDGTAAIVVSTPAGDSAPVDFTYTEPVNDQQLIDGLEPIAEPAPVA